MKVLHVHSGNLFGGVERMLETLAPATAGRTPVESSYAVCFAGAVADALRAGDAKVYTLGPVRARRLDQIWRARRALRSILDGNTWDVVCVHSSWSQAIFGPGVLRRGLPLVRWLHAPRAGPAWLEYWASRAPAAMILCNSRYTRDSVKERGAAARLAVQYPPAALPAEAAHNRDAVRVELGTPLDAVVIVLAARLEVGKGHALLIDGLSRLPAHGWEAWIAGGVQQPAERIYIDTLRRQAEAARLNGRLRFLGQRDDVARLLAAADVYCQPNQAPDSFGLSFIEALAAGLPVVTTRMGAAPEIVNGKCGVLTEPGSAIELSQALARLIDDGDERRAMSVAARSRAREFCDIRRSLVELAAHLTHAVRTTSSS